MRILVTGITGFAGRATTAALLERGHEVHGLARGGEVTVAGVPAARVAQVDVVDAAAVARAVAAVQPEGIVHLAGVAFAPAAESDPVAAYRANVEGTLAVLGAVRGAVPKARLVLVSSSHVYGAVEPSELPITEEVPRRPLDVYGASKVAAEIAALQWARAYGLEVVVARPFNHVGPGQAPEFVCAALARQLARIEAGRQEPVLQVGNVDPVRDFSHVRDIAAGYAALLERGHPGQTYNLCAGEGVSIAEIIAVLRTHARVPVRVWSDPARRRPVEIPRVIGSFARAKSEVGWQPQISLSDSLAEVLADWRQRVASE